MLTNTPHRLPTPRPCQTSAKKSQQCNLREFCRQTVISRFFIIKLLTAACQTPGPLWPPAAFQIGRADTDFDDFVISGNLSQGTVVTLSCDCMIDVKRLCPNALCVEEQDDVIIAIHLLLAILKQCFVAVVTIRWQYTRVSLRTLCLCQTGSARLCQSVGLSFVSACRLEFRTDANLKRPGLVCHRF